MRCMHYLLDMPLKLFSILLEKIRGPRNLFEITTSRTNIEAMTATSIDGVTTTIHCQERKYLCRYDRWFILDRVVYTYFVFATVQGKATPHHIEACSMERSFPKLLHPWMPSASQKEAAIEAYLDLLVHRLESVKKTPTDNKLT